MSQPQVVDGKPISRWPRQLLLPVCCLTALGGGLSPLVTPPKALKAPVIHPSQEPLSVQLPITGAPRSKWPDVPGLYPPTPLSDLIASVPRPPGALKTDLAQYLCALIFRISHL